MLPDFLRDFSTDTEPRIAVVGRGRLGSALAHALRAAGRDVRVVAGRPRVAGGGQPSLGARIGVVILAVPDPAIAERAAAIAPRLAPGTVVLHVAGGLGPEVLEPCRAAGADVGVMHPLVSFASARRTPPLAGTTLVIDGDRRAVRAALRIARELGARPLALALHGPAYHAVAALLANGGAALATLAVDTMVGLGARRRDAERACGALLGTVAWNVAELGVPAALTGPVVRGDAAAVARHRAALARCDPRTLAAYDAIAPAILEVARRAGLSPAGARAVGEALRAEPERARRRPRRA